MPRFRALKSTIRPWLRSSAWTPAQPLPPDVEERTPLAALVNPLFACLPEGDMVTDRAAFALGRVLSRLYEESPDDARNIVRRFLWHMNEESGNIGWGIPEAFGQTLAQSRPLADLYHSILFSYILDKEGDSTWCDHAPLRRSCYNAMDTVLSARPDLAPAALPLLRRAAGRDPDPACRARAEQLAAKYDGAEDGIAP
ncbi:MAG: HEAT repeat domain-containing protein [Desulfovibrionaceae bacterium]|nr:HEAT repeat domain-containing protein [Desulfovibrionaceae bacterium]